MTVQFPARVFNEVMAAIRRSRPLAGLRARVEETPSGVLISVKPAPPNWSHPWTIKPSWNGDQNCWQVLVTPGFVNGSDVVMGIQDSPLTVSPAPLLPLNGFRDATGLNGHYPAFFKKLGARKPEEPPPELTAAMSTSGTTSVTVSMFPEQYGTRRLMAANIVLHVDHAGMRTDTFFADPFTGNLVIHSPAITEAVNRYPYRVQAVPQFQPPEYPTMQDWLDGSAVEPNFDELLLATLWLLSPPDEPDDTQPGPTWEPYPQHFVFWNLGYANLNQLNYTPAEPITIHTGLAFGLLDQIGNALLAPVNDSYQNALNALNSASLRSYFWTL